MVDGADGVDGGSLEDIHRVPGATGAGHDGVPGAT